VRKDALYSLNHEKGELVMSAILNRLRNNPMVEYVDDEREIGNGLIVTLRAGFSFDPMQDNRVMGAESLLEARSLVAIRAKKFTGELTK
jgi:hypothetical protein